MTVAHPKDNTTHQFHGQRSKVKITRSTIAETGSASYLLNGKAWPTNLKLGTQMEYENRYRRQAPWPSRSMVKVTMSRGASDRCWPISREWEVPETQKLVGRLPTPRRNNAHQFPGQRFKVKIIRSTNSETGSVSYLSNGKSYELETWYTDWVKDPYHRRQAPWPPRSKVMVTRSRGPSDRCWPISWEQNVPETVKLVGIGCQCHG